jgi:hypothetical protein
METIIRIKKNKPAFKALILLAKELEKNEPTSISISEGIKKKGKMDFVHEIQKSREEGIPKSNKGTRRTFGYAKNAITIKPDFDEPLEDFN